MGAVGALLGSISMGQAVWIVIRPVRPALGLAPQPASAVMFWEENICLDPSASTVMQTVRLVQEVPLTTVCLVILLLEGSLQGQLVRDAIPPVRPAQGLHRRPALAAILPQITL